MIMTDEEYFALPHISYSKLAAFDREGPSVFENKEDISSKKAVRLGSIVDDIRTNPTAIEDKYFVSSLSKPTASLGLLVDACTESFSTYEEITREKVFPLAKGLILWKSTTKEESYYNKFDKPYFWNYLKSYYQRGGRIVIDSETLELAKLMAQTLIDDIDTKDAFLSPPGVEVVHQHIQLWGKPPEDDSAVFGDPDLFVGYRCKFDILRIDHNAKTLQFIDIKTMEDVADKFERSFYMWRYYIQDSLYQQGLANLRDTEYQGYSLLDPYNIVVSSAEPTKGYRFDIDEQWLEAGKTGFTMGFKYYKGYEELTSNYVWHMKSKIYNYTKDEFYNGKIKTIPFHGKI